MVFSDLLFLFVFLPLFALCYGGATGADRLRRHGRPELSRPMLWRNIVMVLFSVLFYSWGEPVYILLMLLAVAINYACGLGIDGGRRKKLWLTVGVAADLAILGSFKYLGFFAGAIAELGVPVAVPQIALPIGISFYIFQSISYLVDVYRGQSPVQRNFMDLLLYIAMFPQLIAGPIVRYDTVAREINHRTVSTNDVARGIYRFLIGLGKKVILANILGEVATQLLGGDLAGLSMSGAWIGILAFALQIYFDFSGYSDMAIGLGMCVGFHFPENFNHPYTCTSITDFWRRWHMSLGSFFRDYVYIPMGGNRRHQAINILVVWFLTGMWHGAGWNFIIWGLYFGLIIMVEKYTLLRWRIPRPLLHLYSIFVLLVGWGLFYFDDMGRMQQFFTAFFGQSGNPGFTLDVQTLITDNFWIWLAALALCLPLRRKLSDAAEGLVSSRRSHAGAYALQFSRAIIAMAILIISVALLVGATNNAFIYTRF